MTTRTSLKKQRVRERLFQRGVRVLPNNRIESPVSRRLTNGQVKLLKEFSAEINIWLAERGEYIEYWKQHGDRIPVSVLKETEEARLESLEVAKEYHNGLISQSEGQRKVDQITNQTISDVIIGFPSEQAAFEFKMRWG